MKIHKQRCPMCNADAIFILMKRCEGKHFLCACLGEMFIDSHAESELSALTLSFRRELIEFEREMKPEGESIYVLRKPVKGDLLNFNGEVKLLTEEIIGMWWPLQGSVNKQKY